MVCCREFFKDVLPEFEQCGRVRQFRVCTNEEPHLRGNVYVEFGSRRHALKAYRTFQGRFYAGRRLNVEFTTIPSWKNAVCGQSQMFTLHLLLYSARFRFCLFK